MLIYFRLSEVTAQFCTPCAFSANCKLTSVRNETMNFMDAGRDEVG